MITLDPSNSRPLYLQLADYLRGQITAGILKPEDRLTPEVEMAADLAVSRGTVRQALDLLVSQGLLQRIPAKGTFVAGSANEPLADAITTGLSSLRLIGLVVPYLRDALTNEILSGAEHVLRDAGYSLIFCHSENDIELERLEIERLQREHISGLLLFPIALPSEPALLSKIVPATCPLVLIDRSLPNMAASSVAADNLLGAYQVIEHLIAQGHRRIVCVRPSSQASSIQERLQGYEQALYDAGIMPLAPIVLKRHSQSPHESIPEYDLADLEPLARALRVQEPPTALFCINDYIAAGVMKYLLDSGYRIPEDIALAGFDDVPLARYLSVPLTTVAQPKYEVGAHAAQALLDQIAGTAQPGQQIRLPTKLIVRASTKRATG
jgi:DNA-binding LacI/PurR family transcriptional regulator